MARRKQHARAGGPGAAVGETTINDCRYPTPEAAICQPSKLKIATERALELMRGGTRPPLANTLAAREFNVDATQVARRTGAIANEARLARRARREAQP